MKSNGRENNNISITINPEIRAYSESIFLGLTLRQFLFSLAGCITSVGIFFLLRNIISIEAVSWVCMIGMVPFAMLGFVKYNGMPAEQIAMVVIRSVILTPKRLTYQPQNLIETLYLTKKERKRKGVKEEGKAY